MKQIKNLRMYNYYNSLDKQFVQIVNLSVQTKIKFQHNI